MEKKFESIEISLIMKWARESASKQYQLFKKCRVQIRKTKNEKHLDQIKQAKQKERRNKLMKERLY